MKELKKFLCLIFSVVLILSVFPELINAQAAVEQLMPNAEYKNSNINHFLTIDAINKMLNRL